jgi:hypothetical protein
MSQLNGVLRQLNKSKGGVSVDAVLAVLREFDRLETNPNRPTLEYVERVLTDYGYIPLFIFICPDFRPKYLQTDQKELFVAVEEPRTGLVYPRLPKLKALVTALWGIGIPAKTIFCVGDNNYEAFRGPNVGVRLNKEVADSRRALYVANLTKQLSDVFPQLLEVNSIGLMNVGLYNGQLVVPNAVLAREIEFQRMVTQKYYSGDARDEEVLTKIAQDKIRAYAEQGYLLEMCDGLLVCTEGANTLESWTQNTEMLMLGGASFPSIYPYIRKEVLGNKES